jgi:chitin disaccharide deacetylase
VREAGSDRAGISAARRIWLCADDYGLSPAINAAIRELIAQRRLNATSVMIAAPAFHHDEAEAEALSELRGEGDRVAVGLHVTLTAPFAPLAPNYIPLKAGAFLSIGQTMARAFCRRLDSASLLFEVATQFETFISAFGGPPDFVDGHHHVHLLPQVREAVLEVAQHYAPDAWVRQCGRVLPLLERFSDPKGLLLDLLSRGLRKRAARFGLRTNPAFAGTYDFRAGIPFARLFPRFLDRLPDGGVVMCHPGSVDDELRRLDSLTSRREEEYRYLMSSEFASALAAHNVTLA